MRDRAARARLRDLGDHLAIKKLMRGTAELEISCPRYTLTKPGAAGSENLGNRGLRALEFTALTNVPPATP